MRASEILARRRTERAELIALAAAFVTTLPAPVRLIAAVVVGSVARGDFNDASDIDVVLVAEHLPEHPLERAAAVGRVPPRMQPVCWTPADWLRARATGNPLWWEATQVGIWLAGSPEGIEAAGSNQQR